MIRRRALLAAGGSPLLLPGCGKERVITGGFNGASVERGHVLRGKRPDAPPAYTRRVDVLIAGGGIAGLSAARALRLAGIDNHVVLDLEDQPGGNSRGGNVGGIACPLGAHYLPVPGDAAGEVRDFLEEIGVARRVAGRWTYDERHLCHSPQERLFLHGQWQEGLLPVLGVGPGTIAQYKRFARLVEQAGERGRFLLPLRGPVPASHRALDRVTFAQWLDRERLDDPYLRWYLDYCCRDDYGAGAGAVSAWAGLHYFASRHGFAPPGEKGESDALLTWPEGNAWLVKHLAAPLGDRLQPARVVTSVAALKHAVQVETFDFVTQRVERWEAAQCILAVPLFIAARVLNAPPRALADAVMRMRYAPWVVANVHVERPLDDRPGGAAPAWDNVLYGASSLGYVDAGHQKLDPLPDPTVLSWYRALGDLPDGRAQLLSRPWQSWRDEVLGELSAPHPDVRLKTLHIEVARWGHAMAVPVPGTRTSAALAALQRPQSGMWRRLHFAHSDLSGYSIFEEAFTQGWRAAQAARRALGR